ncbi:MAG: hypothetical protein LBL97_09325 [Prevotellaceae bacterium]|nr:hypothetical protein [Prevotellaceae bacterium]
MKKINFLGWIALLLLLPVGVASCSKDNDEEDPAAMLVGTWECVSYSFQFPKKEGVITEHEEVHDARTMFNQDGTFIVFVYDYELGWYPNGLGTWSYNNGGFAIQYGPNEIWTVTTLTSSRLIMEYIKETDMLGTGYYIHEYRKISN